MLPILFRTTVCVWSTDNGIHPSYFAVILHISFHKRNVDFLFFFHTCLHIMCANSAKLMSNYEITNNQQNLNQQKYHRQLTFNLLIFTTDFLHKCQKKIYIEIYLNFLSELTFKKTKIISKLVSKWHFFTVVNDKILNTKVSDENVKKYPNVDADQCDEMKSRPPPLESLNVAALVSSSSSGWRHALHTYTIVVGLFTEKGTPINFFI